MDFEDSSTISSTHTSRSRQIDQSSPASKSSYGRHRQQERQQRNKHPSAKRGRVSPLRESINDNGEGELTPSSSAFFRKISVRRAGASVVAVQDAGTYRMLHDEFLYLCSTILTMASTNPKRATEAAIDLAVLLSSRKTRSVVWKGDDLNGSNSKTVLHSILDVFSTATAAAPGKNYLEDGPSSSGKGRTQSSRRKTDRASIKPSSTSSAPESSMPKNMRQALACILYVLSWDCTMSEKQSAAAIGAVRKASLARKLRRTILEHAGALQGIMKLVSADSIVQVNHQSDNSCSVGSKSVSNSSRHSTIAASRSTCRSNLSPQKAGVPDTIVADCDSGTQTLIQRGKNSPTASSPACSSLSFPDSTTSLASAPALPKTGDPTAKGRRQRRNKRQRFDQISSISKGDLDFDGSGRNSVTAFKPAVASSRDVSTTTNSMQSSDRPGNSLPMMSSSSIPSKSELDSKTDVSGLGDSSNTSAVPSNGSHATAKFDDKIKTLMSRIISYDWDDRATCHASGCKYHGISGEASLTPCIALQSLQRIVNGKDDGCQSCLEEEEKDDGDADGLEASDDPHQNPILQTNQLLGKSRIVPQLGCVLSQSLKAIVHLTQLDYSQAGPASTDVCAGCLSYLHDKISQLAVLVDGACLFSDSNRRLFCESDPFSFTMNNEGLIFHLLLALKRLSPLALTERKGRFGGQATSQLRDVILAVLRTLTSLTHENELAAEQFVVKSDKNHGDRNRVSPFRGLDVLAELLYQLENELSVSVQMKDKDVATTPLDDGDIHRYDCTIFCLNTLVNVVETGDARRLLAEISLPKGESWLRWLCRWLVSQTESFRDAVIGSDKTTTSSSLPTRNTKRELQKQEEDRLVAAGNGCVLLACLMIEPDAIPDDPRHSEAIRAIILEEMPENDDKTSTGVTLVTNTLKAFCNFYHYSLGDLSVAVVKPVKKLIEQLEELPEARNA